MYVVFTPNFGEDEPILTSIFFSKGLKPPTRTQLPGDSSRDLVIS